MSSLNKKSQTKLFASTGSAKRAAHILKDLDEYPHNIHPALVPGVSIEDQKVRYGIEEHGDNFELAIEAVDPESDRGVGNDFDSTAEEYTDWYVRTDEDGNPVEYDYEQGAYIDPETGEPEVKPES